MSHQRVSSPTQDSTFSGLSGRTGGTAKHGGSGAGGTLTGSKKIVTAPPWARHEPPSPEASTANFLGVGSSHLNVGSSHGRENSSSPSHRQQPSELDVASSRASTSPPPESSHWWTFNIPYTLGGLSIPLRKGSGDDREREKEGEYPEGSGGRLMMRERSQDRPRAHWLFDRNQVPASARQLDDYTSSDEETPTTASRLRSRIRTLSRDADDRRSREREGAVERALSRESATGSATPMATPAGGTGESPRTKKTRFRVPQLTLPAPNAPFTLANARTPGWETPWAPPRPDAVHFADGTGAGRQNGTANGHGNGSASQQGRYDSLSGDYEDDLNLEAGGSKSGGRRRRGRRRQAWKVFLLYNNYVPLIIRLLNLTFTTATLAVAITIRRIERENQITGAVGSSPLLAIIFAPPTLVHVMIAIYLEYFGKPVGLWSTSAKLMHTLLEMFFICMWSASLSLCFDNYFTSALMCTPASTTSWWDSIPRELIENQGRGQGGPADQICNDQLALICLVFFGAALYCSNLVISLFRIFEKVKLHGQGAGI